MQSLAPTPAVLLIAHGSRRQEANEELFRVAELVLERGPYTIVEPAYLEIASPDIPTGAARCVERGARHVKLLPYFLSAGAHVVEDLEYHRQELSARYPGVHFELCPPLGVHPLMVEIVLDQLTQESTPPMVTPSQQA